MSDAGGGGEKRGVKRSSRELQQQTPRRPGESSQPPSIATSPGPSTSRSEGDTRSSSYYAGQQHASGGAAAAGPSHQQAGGTSAIVSGGTRGLSRARNQLELVTKSPSYDKHGHSGEKMTVRSNYFQVIKMPDVKLLQYRVDFTPEIADDISFIRKGLIRTHQEILGHYIFDGTLLYTTIPLPQPLELISKRKFDGSDVKIKFALVGEFQQEDATYTSVMCLILRRCMSMLNLVMLKRKYYDKAAKEDVPGHPITIWPGYVTTIRRHERDYLLNVEIVHKYLRRDTAMNVIERIHRQLGRDDFMNRVKTELLGQIVMTLYNDKTYRIDDIDFDKTPMSTFHLRKEDRDITYKEYYQKHYEVNIKDERQFLLVSRPSRNKPDNQQGASMRDDTVYLIPELCGMTGLTEEHRNNFKMMQAVGNITRVTPGRRVETLMKFRRRLAETPQIERELNNWGLQFANQLVPCPARTLKAPLLLTGTNTINTKDGDWGREMQKRKMCVSVKMAEWIVVYPTKLNSQVRSFVNMMKRVGEPQGFHLPEPHYVPLDMDRTSDYINALRDNIPNRYYDIVMCVLRTNRTDTYSAIKKYTFCDRGIASQVITGRIIEGTEGRLMSVATKVMTQIACKLGAEPWTLVAHLQRPWMIVGYDTYHDARNRKAVGAFVASINTSYTRYNSSVKIHPANEDISPSFKDHMLKSLKAYQTANGSYPEKIIVYRDGVGAGDIQTVLDIELEGIQEACKLVANANLAGVDYKPGIAFVIVSKAIKTRFFAGTRDNPSNAASGTVVDDTVTIRERSDFFLVSQKVNQGTVSPTNFNVIFDSTGLAANVHQMFAYSLTHLYYNWPGTVRVPAPMQYAHKLAYLVGERIEREPLDVLAKFPYYL
ncbi:piwi-like protein Siwi isoform X2 [Daphnia pulicaria]|uniref:piwi-like protein Siwi isoform X2 n=1 Tax=Daphnia pulicaria TaxID=35523 RepID=UPI001EEC2DFD|nr:piwi-like protein Siwi isoform X2 [Daphnia pulicaria]